EVYDGAGDDRTNLEEIAIATAAKLARREMTIDQINHRRESGKPRSIANHGWFPKVPAIVKDGKVKQAGSRIVGQIVAARTVESRYGNGKQQVITVFGKCVAPAHKNSQGQAVPKIDKIGRFQVGIDSSLVELPDRVGEVVDIEFQTKGGSGQRHTYAHVDVFDPLDLQPTPQAKR